MTYDALVDELRRAAARVLEMRADAPMDLEFWICSIAFSIVLCFVFIKAADKIEVPNCDGVSGVVSAALGLMGLLTGVGLLHVYVVPDLTLGDFPLALLLVVVASLALAVPMIKLWTRSPYFRTLFAWLIALGAAMGVAMLLHTAAGSFRKGEGRYWKGAEHNKAVENMIKDTK